VPICLGSFGPIGAVCLINTQGEREGRGGPGEEEEKRTLRGNVTGEN